MKLKCLIVDDEPLARRGLQEYCTEAGFLEVVGVAETAVKALAVLREQQVDLLFLDVQMPGMTGIELLKALPQPPLVIFTTAFSEYAVEGFSLNIVDYLVKPIAFDRFLKASLKAQAWYAFSKGPADQAREYFFVKCDNRLEKLHYDELLYAEALQNYVAIQTVQRRYLTYVTFKSVEEYLPRDRFIKVHKSYLVALNKIDSISGNELLIGAHHIPISRGMKDEVLSRILDNRFLKRE